MTNSITPARTTRVSVLLSLFAYVSIGPNACINATRFADFALVRSVAAQTAPNYTFTVISDLTNCDNAGTPVLNNKGQAAFAAHCGIPIGPPGGGWVVLRGDGGPLTSINTYGGSTFAVADPMISINDEGAVAFAGSVGPRPAILVSNGGPVSAVVDTAVHTQFGEMIRPSINNSGAVAFMAVTAGSGYDTVAVANGGSIVTIAGPGTATSSVGVLTGAIEPALNNNGVVSFIGQGASNFGLFTGSGGPLTTISLGDAAPFTSINDVGRVAFRSSANGVQFGDGGPVRTVGSFGTYQAFRSEAAINNASLVAFWAQITGGPSGIFIGPNPATDTVIKTGDVIPGVGTVSTAFVSEEAINDAGQVAFLVFFQPGTGTVARAIVRANPIRQPTMTTLGISPSPGVFGAPVTLTASVAPTSGVATGQVEFFDGATLVGTASLVNGVASLQTTALALGSHRLLAAFVGSSGFLPSISPAVSVVINPPPPLQVPINLRASSIVGNLVTFRWDVSSIGPRPTSFVVEGGITPGGVLASLSTNSAFPIFTVAAPSGAFYVRVHAIAGSERSGPSNEVRIFVNVPTAPSPPENLLALVNTSSLALTWRQTFLGGTPTAHVLNVTGAVNTSMPLGDGNSFTFNGVPGGTYTMSVSASNAGGSSAPSNAVTVTLPGSCSGAPLAPTGFLAYRAGNTVFVVWDPPTSGPAPTSYRLNVTGAFVGSFSTTALTLSGTVGPGSYGLSVLASNACGSSAATTVQTITVP